MLPDCTILPLYANEAIIYKFGLFRSADSNSISLENLEVGWVTWEEVEIHTEVYSGILPYNSLQLTLIRTNPRWQPCFYVKC